MPSSRKTSEGQNGVKPWSRLWGANGSSGGKKDDGKKDDEKGNGKPSWMNWGK